jgi:hypothetical protein
MRAIQTSILSAIADIILSSTPDWKYIVIQPVEENRSVENRIVDCDLRLTHAVELAWASTSSETQESRTFELD